MKDITFKNLTEEQINAIKVLLGDACEIEEQKEEEKEEIPFPKKGDKFYFLLSDGEIDYEYYNPTSRIHADRISTGNCFKTEEEAKFEVERRKVIHEMKKFAEPEDYVWDGENSHHYIYYNFCCDAIRTGHTYSYKKNVIFFKSTDDIRDCIEAVGEDRIIKYYLGVKEEEVNNFIEKTRN